METVNFVLSGLGGQGILFMTKILAQAALDKGFNLMGAETHGMAQRGGSVVSHLRVGDVQGSLVRTVTAHYLLALDENEAYRNITFLSKGGKLYANASVNLFPRQEIREYLDRMGIIYHSLAAGELAMNLGTPMSTNLALLGFYSAFEQTPVTHEELRETVDRVSPGPFNKINLKVFDAGFVEGAGK